VIYKSLVRDESLRYNGGYWTACTLREIHLQILSGTICQEDLSLCDMLHRKDTLLLILFYHTSILGYHERVLAFTSRETFTRYEVGENRTLQTLRSQDAHSNIENFVTNYMRSSRLQKSTFVWFRCVGPSGCCELDANSLAARALQTS
jgi:hypothetical protein